MKISGVTYKNIHGTSATEVGVNLECSKTEPCTEITLDDVVLKHKKEAANVVCENAVQNMDGAVNVLKCLPKK